jgi:hypothetical protein
MVIAKAMDHDDDVEHLFSWLQTPELRYREFAGAREITDAVITWQARPNSTETASVPSDNTQLEEEYPADQFPDQQDAPADIVLQRPAAATPTTAASDPATLAPTLTAAAAPGPAAYAAGMFALGAGGRNTPRRPHYEEPVVPPPIIQTPAPRQAVAPAAPTPTPVASSSAPAAVTAAPVTSQPAAPVSTATAVAPPSTAAARPVAPSNGGGLLGGAYRQNGFNGHGADSGAVEQPTADSQQRGEASLDAVFGRLSGARQRLPDPRDRMRHISGFNPPSNRPR